MNDITRATANDTLIPGQKHTNETFGENVHGLITNGSFPGSQSEMVSDLKQICELLVAGRLVIVSAAELASLNQKVSEQLAVLEAHKHGVAAELAKG